MSTNAKNTTPVADAKTVVPEQKVGEQVDQKTAAVEDLNAALRTVEDQLTAAFAQGITLKIVTDDGHLAIKVVEEGKVTQFFGKAKGVFQRNKKLVIGTAALVVTSVVLKALLSGRESLEDDVEITTERDSETNDITAVRITEV